MKRKTLTVYLLLALAWPAMAGWLFYEHDRVRERARAALLNRARDISNTIALLSRSGRFNVVRQTWLEDALTELTRSGELVSVVLLNSQGETVASAGPPLPLRLAELPQQGARWAEDRVTVVNLVKFHTRAQDEAATAPLAIVIPVEDENATGTRRRFFPSRGERRRENSGTTSTTVTESSIRQTTPALPALPPPPLPPDRERRHIFRKPPWMSQADYESILRERGLHGFVLVLSTQAMDADLRRDLFLRIFLASIGLLALGGIGLAWHGLVGSTTLQMRLLRAHELNNHLREMNLAAAGLAHETRNPLNIVRGLAQMNMHSDTLPPDVRDRSRRITEEVDRVTVRLNEFINYSKPLEPRPAPVDPRAILQDVIRALESDILEKRLRIEVQAPAQPFSIYADESLLRQVLFNLLLNAIQSVGPGGRIRAVLVRGEREAELRIEDDGPGVAVEKVSDIFRPYFTTREQGSGLGLAVVKQIVLAHRWEIDYVNSEWGGAAFRLHGFTPAQPGNTN